MTIIGIISFIAVPRLSRRARAAGGEALKMDLALLQHAVELYVVEHEGKPPDENVAEQLTGYSNNTGTTLSDTKDVGAGIVYGPYLKDVPVMPAGSKKGASRICHTDDPDDLPECGGADHAWWYNSALQVIRPNLPEEDLDDEDKPYNRYGSGGTDTANEEPTTP